MRTFEKLENDDGLVAYRLVFEDEEYLVIYQTILRQKLVYKQTQYKKVSEDEYLILNERIWSLEISQAIEIAGQLEQIEIKQYNPFRVD